MIKIFFMIRKIVRRYPYCKIFLYPIYRIIGLLYSSQIPIHVSIGENQKFMHGLYGIFIAGGTKIGKNVTFYHHVTLGGVNTDSKNKGAPTIGDNCILYPGCKILGNVNIGHNCQIGPNVVIWFDVPADTTVVYEKTSFRFIKEDG